MNAHFPHQEPIVVRDHELRVTRRFPSVSELSVKINERIGPDKVLGVSDPRAVAVRIPVADQLEIAPRDVARQLMRPIGSTFAAGEPLARTRRGMRNVVAATPVAGTLVAVESETGVALVAPAGAGETRALVPGDVERIDGKSAVVIRTVGSRVLGIVGIGNPALGQLRLAVERPDQELTADRVSAGHSGAIVVGGSHAGEAALKKLIEVGAAGLIVGGLVEREVVLALGWKAEDRLVPWRAQPGGRAIADGLPVPLALVATEGFGPLAMNTLAFGLFQELEGRPAVLLTATRVVGAVSRPELIVPDEAALDDDALTGQAAMVPGVPVRLIDQARLGRTGIVASEPRHEHFGEGVDAFAVDVDIADGVRRLVRVDNLEILN